MADNDKLNALMEQQSDEIVQLKSEIERLKSQVPVWNYNIDDAPKDGTEILIYDGCDVFTARYKISNVTGYKPFFAKSCNGELLDHGPYWEENPVYTTPVAWQPMPIVD